LSITASFASCLASFSDLFVSKNVFFSASVIDSNLVFSSSVNFSIIHPQNPIHIHCHNLQPLPSCPQPNPHFHCHLCGKLAFRVSNLVCSSAVNVSPFFTLSFKVLNSLNCDFCSSVNSILVLAPLDVVQVLVEANAAQVAVRAKSNAQANILLLSISK
jgi:hypothetical protein